MKILEAIQLAQKKFLNLSCSSFENMWQYSQEIKNLSSLSNVCSQLEAQNQHKFAEIIKQIADISEPYVCSFESSNFNQICVSTTMQLIDYAKIATANGQVLICDDLQLWKHLQHTVMDNRYLPYDFLEKLHLYFKNPTKINSMNMLNHQLLKIYDPSFAQEMLTYEYQTRNSYNEVFFPENSLARQLLNSKHLDDLPNKLLQILPIEYLPLLNSSIDWYKLAVNCKTFTPQILLGLHNSLQYGPHQVVFCLKHNRIRPLFSQKVLKGIDLTVCLKKWSEKLPLNILAYSQAIFFDHPLLKQTLNTEFTNRIKVPTNLPIANPPLTSRPKSISASGFNQLMQDPYGYYARYILKLKSLERIGVNKFAKEFGISVHKLIEIYIKQDWKYTLNFINNLNLPSPKILWYGRFLRIAQWIDKQFKELNLTAIEAEKEFSTLLAGNILLKARIDAFVLTESGNLVVNFKTGTPPTKTEVTTGYAPQLLVETFLCQNEHPNISTQGEFWHLRGTQPSGIVTSSIAMPIGLMLENLEKIITHYLQTPKPFLACPWPLKKPKYNEYIYLERLTNE